MFLGAEKARMRIQAMKKRSNPKMKVKVAMRSTWKDEGEEEEES